MEKRQFCSGTQERRRVGNLVDGVQGGEQYGWEGEGGDRVTSGGQ